MGQKEYCYILLVGFLLTCLVGWVNLRSHILASQLPTHRVIVSEIWAWASFLWKWWCWVRLVHLWYGHRLISMAGAGVRTDPETRGHPCVHTAFVSVHISQTRSISFYRVTIVSFVAPISLDIRNTLLTRQCLWIRKCLCNESLRSLFRLGSHRTLFHVISRISSQPLFWLTTCAFPPPSPFSLQGNL